MTESRYWGCAECHQPLAHVYMNGIHQYKHPYINGQGMKRDHRAQPVHLTQEELVYTLCDFCYLPEFAWLYTTKGDIVAENAMLESTGETFEDRFSKEWVNTYSEKKHVSDLVVSNSEGWTACEACAVLIEKEDMGRLITRIKRLSPAHVSSSRTVLAERLTPFFATRSPVREPIGKEQTT